MGLLQKIFGKKRKPVGLFVLGGRLAENLAAADEAYTAGQGKKAGQNVYHGANADLAPEDVPGKEIARAEILLLEGTLFDDMSAQRAFMKAAQYAQMAKARVAFALPDEDFIARNHGDLMQFADSYADILVGSEAQIKAFTLKDTFAEAMKEAAQHCDTLVLSGGSEGGTIVDQRTIYDVSAPALEKIEDTRGARDVFFGGVLYGLSQEMTPSEAGDLGAKAVEKMTGQNGAHSSDKKYSDPMP